MELVRDWLRPFTNPHSMDFMTATAFFRQQASDSEDVTAERCSGIYTVLPVFNKHLLNYDYSLALAHDTGKHTAQGKSSVTSEGLCEAQSSSVTGD